MGHRIDQVDVDTALAAVNSGERFDEVGVRLQLDSGSLANALVATRRRQSQGAAREPSATQRAHILELVTDRHWAWARACEPYGVDPTVEESLFRPSAPPADPVPSLPVRVRELAGRHYTRLTIAERAELDHALMPEGMRNCADGHLTVSTSSGEVVIWRADLDHDTLARVGAAFFPNVTERTLLIEITAHAFAEASKPVNRGRRRGPAKTQQQKRAIASIGDSPVLEEQVLLLLAWIRGVRALWKQLYPNGSRSKDGSLLDEKRVPVWVSGISAKKLRIIGARFFAGVSDPEERLAICEAVVRAVYENPVKGTTAQKAFNRRVNKAAAMANREDLREPIQKMIVWLTKGGPES